MCLQCPYSIYHRYDSYHYNTEKTRVSSHSSSLTVGHRRGETNKPIVLPDNVEKMKEVDIELLVLEKVRVSSHSRPKTRILLLLIPCTCGLSLIPSHFTIIHCLSFERRCSPTDFHPSVDTPIQTPKIPESHPLTYE